MKRSSANNRPCYSTALTALRLAEQHLMRAANDTHDLECRGEITRAAELVVDIRAKLIEKFQQARAVGEE